MDDVTHEQLLRCCRNLLLMVAELHRRGYERLRAMPGMAPSGLYWRLSVYPAEPAADTQPARYTTGDGLAPFGWSDAAEDGPVELADKFVVRFPQLTRQGRGSDPDYVAWYGRALALTEPLGYLVAYDDDPQIDDMWRGVTGDRTVAIPPPPPRC